MKIFRKVKKSQNFSRQFNQILPRSNVDEIEQLFKDVTLYDLARVFKKTIENRPVITQFELNREPV